MEFKAEIMFTLLDLLVLASFLAASATSSSGGGNDETRCDVFDGSWVLDESYPLYDSSKCPHLRREFDCQKYGRPDKTYLKYRWQPNACDVPRFDGKEFLRRWKGKEIMFVGDSLSLNQWQSLLCMLNAAEPVAATSTTAVADGAISTVQFEDYNTSVRYYRSPYLVDIVSEDRGRVLKLNSMGAGEQWRQANLLIFNTWHWWSRSGEYQPWDLIEYDGEIYEDMNRTLAFNRALVTWAKWVDAAVDSNTTNVFYQGVSPSHYHGVDWGESNSKSCKGETEPFKGRRYPAGAVPQEAVVKEVLKKMKKPVNLLDITYLSQLRKDAHPAPYNGIDQRLDCSHWCVGGLPDVWNELMYALLL